MKLNPFDSAGPRIAASILSADFANPDREIADALRGGADFVHLDVMDGHFVPNISFGPPVIKSVREATECYLDAHLMISEPLRYAGAIVAAGADNITFHVETVDDPAKAAREIRKLGCNVGITLNPVTAVETIWPVLEEVDVVLVMSVVPGFSGQKFMPEVLGKCEAVRKRLAKKQRLEIDGGINLQTIPKPPRDAGVDWFVVASAIFDQSNRKAAIADIRARME